MSDNSATIREAVEKYFEAEGFKFSGFDENGFGRTSFRVKTKIGHAEIIFHAQPDRLMIRSMIPLTADEDTRLLAAEYILRANYGIKNGGFDLDFDDGEISFRLPIYCGQTTPAPTHDQINFAVDSCLFAVQRYSDGLARVLYGMETPKDAIAKIESK